MGFRQANIYIEGLAKALEIDEDTLLSALAENRSGGYARVWEINDEGNFAKCRLSTSKKDGKKFIPDFSEGFVSFVGNAYEKIKDLEIPENSNGKSLGISIQITSCEATTFYSEKKGETYHNYAVFAFEFVEEKSDDKKSSGKSKSSKNASTKKTTKSTRTKEKAEPEDETDGFQPMLLDEDLPF